MKKKLIFHNNALTHTYIVATDLIDRIRLQTATPSTIFSIFGSVWLLFAFKLEKVKRWAEIWVDWRDHRRHGDQLCRPRENNFLRWVKVEASVDQVYPAKGKELLLYFSVQNLINALLSFWFLISLASILRWRVIWCTHFCKLLVVLFFIYFELAPTLSPYDYCWGELSNLLESNPTNQDSAVTRSNAWYFLAVRVPSGGGEDISTTQWQQTFLRLGKN